MTICRIYTTVTTLLICNFYYGSAHAGQGLAVPWQMGFQDAASPVMEEIIDIHNFLLWIIIAIALFVMLLMGYVFVRFRAAANPVPSKTTHNALLEVLWTVIPILILVVVCIPALKLMYYNDRVPDAEMTIKAIGHQWYWSYEYPDHGNFTFDAVMLEDEERTKDQPRLLATDTSVVVPINTKIRLLVTSEDVIHAWAIPAFGVKKDGLPGRLNETWFQVDRKGTYYGQCSELCGVRHGFMPIQVEAVSKMDFAKWIEFAKKEYAEADFGRIEFAARTTK